MKFTELKQSLKEKINPVYFLVGNDIFLINKAEELIKNAVCLNSLDIDSIPIFVEDSFDIKNLIIDLSSYSMMGGKRVFILKNAEKVKQTDSEKLKNFLENNTLGNVLVIVDTFSSLDNYGKDVSPIYKMMFNLVEIVNCNHLELEMIEKLVVKHVSDAGKQINSDAIKTITDFCMADLSQIYMELDKLIVLAEKDIITKDMIEKNVEKNEEYAFFELANCLAEKNKEKALKIALKLIETKQTGGIISSIYNQFARMFFASVNTGSEEELGKILGVKPYSIVLAKKAAKIFSQKQLRNILKAISDMELKTRQGDLKEDVAILNIVLEILKG